ncbi:hypothetical protein [Methylobacter sp.]|uniref:hypothetical protein n=1 Tax=Methylobacter sp. TaxID=2051955 RepID=UPI00248847FD|nr:hypothetical protein [Methylobacter sp.]MDI1278876.1 hypothetical protein [Methylobacter sp.]MDI1359713.1 hypothetical protein [Methylobacter sp.]
MNNKFTKRVLILVLSLMALVAFSNTVHSADTLSRLATYREAANTNENMTDRYALPPSKVHIETCQREVLRLHPGDIEKQRLLYRHGDFLMRYEIQARDGQVWFMLCDLTTGKIIDAF